MVNASAYFDLYDLLVNEVVGSLELFTILGVILIFLLCRKMGVTYFASILFSTIFISIILAVAYNPVWLAYTVIGSVSGFFMALGKVGKR